MDFPLGHHTEAVAAQSILSTVHVAAALDTVTRIADWGRRIAGGPLIFADTYPVAADVGVASTGTGRPNDLSILDIIALCALVFRYIHACWRFIL